MRPTVQRGTVGLTAPGVFVIVLAAGLVGMLVDAFTVDSGWIFGVVFVIACAYAALQVRRRDLLWAVIAPPLVYLVLTIGREIVDPGTRGNVTDRALDVVSRLAEQAPALWVATVVAGVIVLIRWRGWRGAR